MAIRKKTPHVEYTVEVDEDTLIGIYVDWHTMHALRCEVGHYRGDDSGLADGTVYVSPGYMTEWANVANVFGDDMSDETYDRLVTKIEAHLKAHDPGYPLTELAKRRCAVRTAD